MQVDFIATPFNPWSPYCYNKTQSPDKLVAGKNFKGLDAIRLSFDSFDNSYWYLLQHYASKKYLVINYTSKKLSMEPLSNWEHFSYGWKMRPLQNNSRGYRLSNQLLSYAKSLDQDSTDNSNLYMADTNNYTGQHWYIIPNGDGTFRLITEYTGNERSLSFNAKTNLPVMEITTDFSDNQLWYLVPKQV